VIFNHQPTAVKSLKLVDNWSGVPKIYGYMLPTGVIKFGKSI